MLYSFISYIDLIIKEKLQASDILWLILFLIFYDWYSHGDIPVNEASMYCFSCTIMCYGIIGEIDWILQGLI